MARSIMQYTVSAAVAGLVAVQLSSAAFAQGTSTERHACMGDAMSLCSSDIPDASRIEACLRRERASVSPACSQVLAGGADVQSTGSVGRRRVSK